MDSDEGGYDHLYASPYYCHLSLPLVLARAIDLSVFLSVSMETTMHPVASRHEVAGGQ